MSRMSLDTAIRLSAEVKGGGNIDRVKRSLQDLGQAAQVTKREKTALRTATLQLARANDGTIAGIRTSVAALRGLQEQARIGGREFQKYGAEIQRLEGRLRSLDSTAKSGNGLSARNALLAGAAGGIAGAISAQAGMVAAGAFQVGLNAESAQVRLKALTGEFGEYNEAQAAAARIASTLRISNIEAQDSFASLYASLRPTGVTLDEIEKAFIGFSAAVRNSGATAQESSAALIQLKQALASGVLQGEELRSIREQAPLVAQAIAAEMGVTIGELKKLGAEGKITTDIVLNALNRLNNTQLGKLNEQFKTGRQALVDLRVASENLGVTFARVFGPSTVTAINAVAAALRSANQTIGAFSGDQPAQNAIQDRLRARQQAERDTSARPFGLFDFRGRQQFFRQREEQLFRQFQGERTFTPSSVSQQQQQAQAAAAGEREAARVRAAAASGGAAGSGGSAPSFQPSSRARALIAAAQKLGVSPLDLATIISFETAGTFSPSIRGGAGGNYQGLIQFGIPERRQYGVTPNQSFEEQVTGPVVRYFQDRFKGVGMSTQGANLEDLYTTVLAGNPRANRNSRDSFGTSPRSGVARMGPHRQKALQMFFGGSVENTGFDAFDQAQANNAGFEAQQQAAEQLRERQQATTTELEKFIEARTQAVVKLNQESELLGATTDLDRRRLEYAFEQLEINDRAIQAKREFQELEKQLVELGIDYNAEQQLARIESEKEHALKNAQVKAEQDINDLMAERVRMMQQLTSQAAEPAAFQTQGMAIEAQIATLKDDLAEMTSIATLAGKSAETIGGAFGNAFRDLISGAASARQVLAGFFQDVAQGFAQMAAEIIAKQMAMIALQTILKALGAVAGASSGGTFAPSNVGPFGAAGASTALSFDPSAMVPRALGGPTASGQPYKVGENGPELFVPYQAGTIIPAEATEALQAINNASLRGLQVPFQATAATAAKASQQGGGSSSSSGLSVPFQRGMEGLSVPFQRGGMDGGMGAAGMGGGGGDGLIRFETVQIGELDFVTKDEAQRIGRESAKQGAALALKRYRNNPTDRRGAGLP
jgi:tape measure domain-containing protein